jgi:hypothetical protein
MSRASDPEEEKRTTGEPLTPPLQMLVELFEEIERQTWSDLRAAGIVEASGYYKEEHTLWNKIAGRPTNGREARRQESVRCLLLAAMNARRAIDAIKERNMFRAVDAAYQVGRQTLLPAAQSGSRMKRAQPRKAERDMRWLNKAEELVARGFTRNGSSLHIAGREGVPYETVRSGIRRARAKKAGSKG